MGNIQMIRADQLYPHPDNPRKNLGDITELTESIRTNGILQNLTVVPFEDDKYQIVIGHRRFAAGKAAGVEEFPCTVTNMDMRQQLCTMMEENMQRRDLTIPEQAYGFQYMFDLGESITDIAEKTGFAESTIKHRLELAKLDRKALKAAVSENSSHQMTLKDLMLLEKIKDIDNRNKALKRGTDYYGSFENTVNQIVREEKREAVKEKWMPLLEAAGVTQAPEGVHYWDSAYVTVKEISLDIDKVPKKLQIKDYDKEKPLMMQEAYGYIHIIQKVPKKERKLDKWELERLEEEKKEKELNKKASAALKELQMLGIDVYEGNITATDDEAAFKKLWNFFTDSNFFISSHKLAYLDKQKRKSWEIDPAEFAEFKKNLSKRQPSSQLFVYLCANMGLNDVPLIGWDRRYREDNGKKAMDFYGAAKEIYGFEFSDSEFLKIFDGTHELYEREKA